MDTIKELLQKSTDFLKRKDIESPRLEAEILLADLVGLKRIELYTKFDTVLTPDQKDGYRERIQERGKSKPVAHILGYRDFYEHRFYVDGNVLIPRPETEELISETLKLSPDVTSVLDLCCGSGCVGISIAAQLPDAKVVCSDISPDALEVCVRNAKDILGDAVKQVEFLEGDLFAPLQGRKFNAILANPPYLEPNEVDILLPQVRDYEPGLALFHPDPEGLYDQIIKTAPDFLEEGGFLGLELCPRWAESTLKTAEGLFAKAEIRKDLAGLERYLFAWL